MTPTKILLKIVEQLFKIDVQKEETLAINYLTYKRLYIFFKLITFIGHLVHVESIIVIGR